ncbi:MAG: 16S rRNA (cytosine(1402)-N(4))-methyltransferase RsmH [Phycisphaerales bacterium]|nr:16S rRNA (cytosine(1402)-N(4))-methyltransferase RsmH [Phycisphaerales bacterium]MCB9836521.1 16S rRNA (cytosine(1402)-N(4))-methyltransferase RsmH [Phycisphaera sp.]
MDEGSFDHIPVLARQVIELLGPEAGDVYVDATAGLGGHAAMVAGLIGPSGTIVLNDLDAGNLERADAALRASGFQGVLHAIHGSFADLPRKLEEMGLRADVVLADLGFASNQVDDPERGLTFRGDGPLDMRLDRSRGMTAAEMVNEFDEGELADVIYQFGEERASRRIASAIVRRRKVRPFETTGDLAEVVRKAAGPPPKGRKRIDRATRTFQAIRIAVNGELDALETLLVQIERGAREAARRETWLRPGARVGVISFHSLEDRPVKRAFVAMASEGLAERVTRKPAIADEAEESENPRSRSAKFRVIKVLRPGEPDRR